MTGTIEKKIIQTSTGIRIHPYDKEKCRFVENTTTIWNPSIHQREHVTGFIEDGDYLTHPFSLAALQQGLSDYVVTFQDVVRPKITNKYEMILNNNVRDAVKGRAQIQYDSIQQLAHNQSPRAFVNVPTGYGKTYIAIFYACMLQQKTLVLCYKTKILQQWHASFTRLTNINGKRILLINSSKILEGILQGTFDSSAYDIFICTPKLLHMFAKNHGWNSIGDIMEILGIGLKIYDEAHYDIGNIVRIDASTSVRKTLYLSADFNQADRFKRELFFRMFFNVPVIKVDKELMDELKYTNAVVVKYDSKPAISDTIGIITRRHGFSNYNYMKYQIENGMIIDILCRVINTILKSDKNHRILILLNMIEHVDVLYASLAGIYGSDVVGRFHSEVEMEEKNTTTNKAKIIISIYASFSTGVDTEDIRHIISLDQVNEVTDNQAAGRSRPPKDGQECFYYMFIDTGFDYCKTKLTRRLNYLKESKIKNIYKLNY